MLCFRANNTASGSVNREESIENYGRYWHPAKQANNQFFAIIFCDLFNLTSRILQFFIQLRYFEVPTDNRSRMVTVFTKHHYINIYVLLWFDLNEGIAIFRLHPRFVFLLAQLCHLLTISDFWELNWIISVVWSTHLRRS